uniref:Nuclear pore complex protein Nup153 n=1 Tax=Tetraodon nigroviridis TaxID=99883 RepID=H3CUV8_TETNG
GGGKISSRRYHIASKPYAKSKQQQQSRLISRVTDTVKSIVPSWLQKYFNNENGPEGGGSDQGRDENCQLPPSPPPQPPNGNEEGPPVDGRDSPEPSTSNTATEPTTSRASLNFQEFVLSRPPLNRSHLHFTPLDVSSPNLGNSNSLFSQPSMSSAPGPFTTGFSLVKEIKDNLSQHEDDNISTTSGFSSRASDKDVPTTKTASLPQLWSPEMDRSHTGPQPSQSSMKKPAFNLSVFGTSSNASFNNTVLNSSRLGDSPFYPGKTTYGGAAAARSSRNRPGTPYQAPVRRQIKAKPAGAQPCGVTSATARRVLQSLERMSSPLADARRIPASASSPLSRTMDSINLDALHSQAKKKRMDITLPPVQKLVVPSVAPVSGNRSMSFRPTLTPGGVSRPLDKTPASLEETGPCRNWDTSQDRGTIGYSAPAYPLSSTPAANSVTCGGGKMKRERSSMRASSKRHEEDEVPELPDLPPISLPISSTTALPTFSFTSPLLTATISSTPSVTVTPAKSQEVKIKTTPALSPPSVPFTFSSPIVKATPASTPSFSPSAGFTFSAPVAKGPSISIGKLANPKVAAGKFFVFPVKPATSKSTDVSDGLFKPAKTLKQGSVLDLLKTPGFSSPVPTGPAPQQTAASPPATTTTSSTSSSAGFGDLFKAVPGWNCDVCLVQNKPSDTKCVCCMTPQPESSSSAPSDGKPPAASSAGPESSSSTSTTTTAGFAAVFTKPAGSWDCDTCLVRNKSDAVKCVACETAKPGTGLKTSLTIPSAFSAIKAESAPASPASTGFVGFGDKFKKPEGAWECDTCMVENKAEDTKCVACMNTKPEKGASAEASAEASTPASAAPVLGFGDAFKKPEGSWECDVCLVQNKAADGACVACQTSRPGAKAEPKAGGPSSSSTFGSSTSGPGGFKFGTSESSSASVSQGFKFGASFGDSSAPATGFKFGAAFGSSSSEPASQGSSASSGFKFGGSSEGFKFGTASNDEKPACQPAAASGFKFGTAGVVFGTGASSTESEGGFSFGVAKAEEKTPPATAASSVGSPAAPQEKSESLATTSDAVSNVTATSESTTTAAKGSVFAKLGGPSSAAPAPQADSLFGSSAANKEPAAPTFTFGKPEEKKDVAPSPAPSGFVFGGANKDGNSAPAPATTGGFTFGKPGAPSEPPPPVFSFGKSADTNPSNAPKPEFSFLVSNPTNPTTTAAAAAAAAAAASSSSITTQSLFGGSAASSQPPAPPAASGAFVFGQPATSSGDGPPAKAAFVFGQGQESQASAPPAAALNSTASPSPAQPFIFGVSASGAAPPAAAPSFGFGAAAPSATSSSGLRALVSPSAASSPFTFSSAPSGGFGAGPAPSFGPSFGSPFTAPPSQSPPTFGASPNPTPVFGQQANSTPAFGAGANSSSGGGFQFRASGFGATNNTSSVFTFGAGAAASPAPPANPAIPPQTGATGAGFSFAQAPAFNIGSTKSFTASPAGQQAIAGRKFKMAVRRRK